MKTLLATAAIALTLGAGFTSAYAADIKEQPIAMVKVDVQGVSDGYRASKLIGTAVRNDNKESIGKVDDLLVSRSDKVLFAVVDVGSFLGMGGKLVVIPYDSISVEQDGDKQILVVPGATKDALKSLPKFEYAK
jgi:ribosomal 30S subunit maturation factor RimM